MENKINAVSFISDDYDIYASYDVSGYDYWTLKQEENNYIIITIHFKNLSKDYTTDELLDIDIKVSDFIESLLSFTP